MTMQITTWWSRSRARPRGGQLLVLGALIALSVTFLLLTTVTIRPPVSPCTTPSFMQDADPAEVTLYFTPRSQQVSQVVSNYLVEPDSQLCTEAPYLLILVPSPPGAVNVRDAVRRTWGSAASGKWPHGTLAGKVAVVFVVGQRGLGESVQGSRQDNLTALRDEAEAHKDVLVADFHDSYRNLTRKVLAGLNWVSLKCPGARFVMKADQDTFVHVERLVSLLHNISQERPLSEAMLGETLCSEPVVRDPGGRVAVDPESYPFSVYPPYVRGGTYVLGGRLVPRLVNVSRYMPYLPVEDAFINGVLGHVLRVDHVHLPRVMQATACSLSPCLFVKARQLSATDVSPALMADIWKALSAGPHYCDGLRFLFTQACAWATNLFT